MAGPILGRPHSLAVPNPYPPAWVMLPPHSRGQRWPGPGRLSRRGCSRGGNGATQASLGHYDVDGGTFVIGREALVGGGAGRPIQLASCARVRTPRSPHMTHASPKLSTAPRVAQAPITRMVRVSMVRRFVERRRQRKRWEWARRRRDWARQHERRHHRATPPASSAPSESDLRGTPC